MNVSKRFSQRATANATREEFDLLSHDAQRQAIRNMAYFGYGDYHIAAATRLSVEQIRHILAEREERED